MKKFQLLIVAATAMVLAFSASAQEKIATVNVTKLYNGYYKTKMARNALDKKNQELTKEIKDMADGLDKARGEYKDLLDQANDQAISADERQRRQGAAQEKQKEISDSTAAIQSFRNQASSQLQEQDQRMTEQLINDIKKAVADKAKVAGYNIVLNTGSVESVVYASTDNDITDAVLTQLNAGAPIDFTKPADLPAVPALNSTNSP